jgi:hypothetical protein
MSHLWSAHCNLTILQMAKAGFVFTPQTPGDDTGTCLYCGVSLGGWDEDDDPL